MKLKSVDYKKLCKRIHREYGKKLNMSYFDSCEVCDAVLFGEMTIPQLEKAMQSAVEDNA